MATKDPNVLADRKRQARIAAGEDPDPPITSANFSTLEDYWKAVKPFKSKYKIKITRYKLSKEEMEKGSFVYKGRVYRIIHPDANEQLVMERSVR